MFHTLFYEPLYNILVVILTYVPGYDAGIAVILLTLFVKGLLYPLNKKAAITQHRMKGTEKEIRELKEKHKHEPQVAGQKMMELYKERGINPFAGILSMLIQLPILFALYFVFFDGIKESSEDLYSFLTFPEGISNIAFGFLDLTNKYIWIGIATGVSYFFLAYRQTQSMTPSEGATEFQTQFASVMKKQMLYVFPILAGVTAIFFPAALGIYFITSNLFGIIQDVIIRKQLPEFSKR